jgi:hypothetical protein
MSAMFCLGFTSAAVARRAIISSRSDNDFPLQLWVLVIASSGANKSAPFHQLCSPFEIVQVAFETGKAPASPRSEASPVQPRTRYERLRAEVEAPPSAAYLQAASWADLPAVLERCKEAQAHLYPDTPVDFLAFDATPAGLIEQMSQQVLGVVQAAAEGGFASWISGGGRAAVQLGNLNYAWDGRSIRRGRVNRSSPAVQNATLTMVCSPQTEIFNRLLRNGPIRESGYLPRFLICYPESRQGKTTHNFVPVPPAISAAYREHIWALMTLTPVNALKLSVDDDGERLIGEFYDEIEPRLADGADLAPVADWVQKLRLNMVRIAGVQHLARYAADIPNGRHCRPIDAETVAAAIEIARWMIPHGQRAFGTQPVRLPTSASSDEDYLLDVLTTREQFRNCDFTVRDVHRSTQSRFKTRETITTALKVFEARGQLTSRKDGKRVLYSFASPPK